MCLAACNAVQSIYEYSPDQYVRMHVCEASAAHHGPRIRGNRFCSPVLVDPCRGCCRAEGRRLRTNVSRSSCWLSAACCRLIETQQHAQGSAPSALLLLLDLQVRNCAVQQDRHDRRKASHGVRAPQLLGKVPHDRCGSRLLDAIFMLKRSQTQGNPDEKGRVPQALAVRASKFRQTLPERTLAARVMYTMPTTAHTTMMLEPSVPRRGRWRKRAFRRHQQGSNGRACRRLFR
jgi:hypothetical protein